ncbi:hypothetical protein [Pedobacter ginsengisoli]|nr:hypothetical protein [Pedobacter ginsengisoli]
MRPELNRNPPNHKNLEALKQIEARLSSTKRVYKNSIRAKLNGTTSQKAMNPVISGFYHVIVNKVKELYSKLPNKEDRVIIELNNELDPTDSHGLFTLITPTFFFYLECSITNQYRIEYQFHNCPVEEEIQQLINAFSMRSYSTEVVNQPDYPAFFQRCLQVQPDRFIHQL